jgi:hypothetical protein
MATNNTLSFSMTVRIAFDSNWNGVTAGVFMVLLLGWDEYPALMLRNKKGGAERVRRPDQGPASPKASHPAPPKKVVR